VGGGKIGMEGSEMGCAKGTESGRSGRVVGDVKMRK